MLDMSSKPRKLQFKNFKGGHYRATTEGGIYQVRKAAPDAWYTELKVEGEPSFGQISAQVATTREDAEAAAQRHNDAHGPAELLQQAAQRKAIAAVASVCAQRRGLVTQLEQVNQQLQATLVDAFDAGVTAGPLLEITEPAGITTRNRLYQIRDGKR